MTVLAPHRTHFDFPSHENQGCQLFQKLSLEILGDVWPSGEWGGKVWVAAAASSLGVQPTIEEFAQWTA